MIIFWSAILLTILINANLMLCVYQYFLKKKNDDDKYVISKVTKSLDTLLDACRAAMDRDDEILAEEMIKDIERYMDDL